MPKRFNCKAKWRVACEKEGRKVEFWLLEASLVELYRPVNHRRLIGWDFAVVTYYAKLNTTITLCVPFETRYRHFLGLHSSYIHDIFNLEFIKSCSEYLFD